MARVHRLRIRADYPETTREACKGGYVTAGVEIRQSDDGDTLAFEATITEGNDRTVHRVTVGASNFERLRRGEESAEEFIRRCFEFLLAREPKESIMSSFDVSVISRYFPEFEQEISR